MNDGPKIRAGIDKSFEWFKNLVLFEEIPEDVLEDAKLRLARMMATCYIENDKVTYEVNDERIFMISYVIALGFARRGTLTNYFAEAFAFTMGSVILAGLTTQRRIIKLGVDDDFTMDFLKLVKRFTTKTTKNMKLAGVDPVVIARYYIYTMFTDCFDPAQTFLIFDNIVLELAHYRAGARGKTYESAPQKCR